jgi:bacterioferritin-associated ferredoxin
MISMMSDIISEPQSLQKISVSLQGHDLIHISFLVDGEISSLEFEGCQATGDLLGRWVKDYGKNISKWPLPKGFTHSELLLKELIQKSKGEWKFPYEHEELCHCRNVKAVKVDQAIMSGAFTIEAISRQTQACTGCGTCRSEIERLIRFRQQV